jgi:hypothetical protein
MSRSRPGRLGRLALAVAAGLALPADSALGLQATATPERIEVVLDASSDMRAPIGGVERMDVAKEFLSALRSGLSVGPALRLYGAASPRPRRDCADTRLVVEPGAPPGRWSETLAGVQPRGISPLGAALRQAAADSVSTYVLVTEGGDDCRADPCTVWKETIGGGPNRRSRLHVVGLDPQPAALEELRCLSRAGSGSFTLLDTPDLAADAGRRLALILRNEGLVEVRATLGRGGERLPLPVRIVRPVTDEVVVAFTAREPRPVPAGVYRVVVESVPPLTFERVMVLPGETTTLDASSLGRLRVELLDETGLRMRAPVSIRSGDGRRELRYLVSGEDAIVQTGAYDISVDLGDSIVEQQDVTVSPGRTTRVAFGGGGTLLVLAPEFESPPPTRILAFRAGGVDTLSVGAAEALPAGSYRLLVETIPVFVHEDVVVRDESQTVVTLPETGILGVELRGPDGFVSGVEVEVREVLTGEAYAALASGERRLAMPGRYDLEARTVPPATFAGVGVTPGRESVVRREGLSRLVVAPPRGAVGPYRLEVLTPAGDRRLGEALGAAPELPVWPGAYLVRVWHGRELAWEGRVAVASDKTARIDLSGS